MKVGRSTILKVLADYYHQTDLLSRLIGFIVIAILPIVFALNLHAQVSVEVSPKYSSIAKSNSLSLPPDEKETFELPVPLQNDVYKLIYSIEDGSMDVIAFDTINVINNNPSPSFLLNTSITGSSIITIPNGSSKEGVVVSLINDSYKPKNFSYAVFRLGNRKPNVVLQLKKIIEIPVLAMSKFYRLPKFRIVVVPCGSVNAYSSPDITICSELISDLFEKDLTGALYPIIYHEMAHTLLNIWNLPGFDNEDMADEFSAAMLAREFPSYINQFIKYLENEDSTTEAIVQLTKGSRHTLSIQRARNMRAAINKIDQIEKRWENFLKPYKLVKSVKKKSTH